MTHLYLHIGMHKTGTSSIQETLFRNRHILAEAGYAYLEGRGNHSGILYSAFSSTPEKLAGHRKNGQRDRAALRARAEGVQAHLDRFLRECGQPKAVMSGEALSRLAPEDVRQMLEFFRARVERITVIGFVRPPRSFMVSAMQQRIRGGRRLDNAIGPDWPRYRDKFGPYLEAKDLAETRLTIYARSALLRGCSIATMLSLCDAPPELYDRMELHQENLSMSRAAATLVLGLNALRKPGAAPKTARSARLGDLLRALPGPRLTVPNEVLDAYLCRPTPRRHVAWMERQLGRSFAEFEAPIPEQPARAVDPQAWATAQLSYLTRADATELAARLRQQIAPKGTVRRRRERALGPIAEWLEARLAESQAPVADDAPWLTAEDVRRLAAMLAEAEKRMAEEEQAAPSRKRRAKPAGMEAAAA